MLSDSFKYLELALHEASNAFEKDEVPVGAIVVLNNQIIGRGHNLCVSNNNPLLHAEVVAIKDACKALSNWRLDGCILYSTLEPCLMCTGAIIQARITKVYFGALDENWGCILSNYTVFDDNLFGHKVKYEFIKSEPCAEILKEYFRGKR